MKKFILLTFISISFLIKGNAQTILAGWTFDNLAGASNGSTGATPTTVTSAIGSVSTVYTGTMYANGSNGSGSWTSSSTASSTQLDSRSGTTTGDPRSSSSAGRAISVDRVTTTPSQASIVFSVTTLGYTSISLTYVTQKGTSGFTTQKWDYSTNGTNYSSVSGGSPVTVSTSVTSNTITLPSYAANASNLYVRVTFSGGSGSTASTSWNLLDNVLIKSNDYTWSGVTNTSFSTASNWVPSGISAGTAPTSGSNIVFQGTPTNNPSITTATTVGNIIFLSGTSAITFGGSSNLTINDTILNNSTNTQTFSPPITLGASPVKVDPTSGNIILNGIISSSNPLIENGAYVLTLSAANTYTGSTTITDGTLNVTGSLASGSAVSVGSSGTLTGTGTVNGTVSLFGTIDPGSSTGGPGTIATGSISVQDGSTINVDMDDTTGASGTIDKIAITGSLDFSSVSSGITVSVASYSNSTTPGDVPDFLNTNSYVWTIVTTTGGITGFNASLANVDVSNFTNALGTGSFSIVQNGNNLELHYSSCVTGAWLGTVSTDWNNTSNWCGGSLPTTTTDVTIASGLTNYPSVLSSTAYCQNLTVTGGTVTVNGGTLDVSGDINENVSGGMVYTSGTLSLSASGDQTIYPYDANAPTSYQNLSISGSGTKSVIGEGSVAGQLSLASGTIFSINGHYWWLSGTVTGTGTIQSSTTSRLIASSSGNLGTLYFDQTTPGTTNVLQSLLMTGTNTQLTLGNALEVTDTVQIAYTGGGTALTSSGNLTLTSTSTQTALLYEASTSTTSTVSGNVVVQRYAQASASYGHYFSSPVSSASIYSVQDGSYNVLQYNENANRINTTISGGWRRAATFTSTMAVARGYSCGWPSVKTVNFTGTLNNGSQSYTCTNTPGIYDSTQHAGWNLIGNPYPSPVDIGSLNFSNIQGSAVNLFDSQTGNYSVATSGTVESGRAFFVQAGTGGGTVGFTNAARLLYGNNSFSRIESIPELKLTVLDAVNGNDTVKDYAYLHIGTQFSDTFDIGDSRKLLGYGKFANVYFPQGINQLSINAINDLSGNEKVVPLNLKIQTNGVYSLLPEPNSTFTTGYNVLLKDSTQSGVVLTDISTLIAPYSFSYNLSTDSPGRLSLVVSKSTSTVTSVPYQQLSNVSLNAFGKDNKVFLQLIGANAQQTATVQIWSAEGKLVYTGQSELSGNQTVIELNVPSGIYMVKALLSNAVYVKKVFLNN